MLIYGKIYRDFTDFNTFVCWEQAKQAYQIMRGQNITLLKCLATTLHSKSEFLTTMSAEFDAYYARTGHHSIQSEKLMCARLFQVLYSMRSEQ